MSESIESPVYTVQEAATYLKCGPKVVRRLVRLKKIPAQVVDRRGTIRLHKNALDSFLVGR